MKKVLTVLLGAFALAGAAHAANIVWSGAANDGNKWSTGNNWEGGAAPTSTDEATFNVAEATTIDVDGDVSVSRINIDASSAALTFGGSGMIRLYYSNSNASHANASVVNANRTSVATTFDCGIVCHSTAKFSLGPGLILNGAFSIGTTCNYIAFVAAPSAGDGLDCVRIRGNFNAPNATVYPNAGYHANNAPVVNRVIVECTAGNVFSVKGVIPQAAGGQIDFASGRAELVSSGGGFTLNSTYPGIGFNICGGDVYVPGGPMTTGGGTNGFNLASGSLTYGKLNGTQSFVDDSYLLLSGFKDGVLGAGRKMTIQANYTLFNAGSTYDELVVDGELFVTNANTKLTINGAAFENAVLRGSGAIYARDPIFANAADISANIYCSGSMSTRYVGMSLDVRDATIGTWGDFRYDGVRTLTVNLSDSVTFDTANAFGSGETHSIWLATAAADDNLRLTAEGGGTVALVFAAAPLAFDMLTVAAGTTLCISNATSLSVNILVLDDGARLVCDAADITAGTATVGDGAVLGAALRATGCLKAGSVVQSGDFTLNASVLSGTADGVWPLVSGAGIDISRMTVNFADATSAAYVMTVIDGVAYAAPGSIVPDENVTEWTGAANGLWSNSGNWTHAPSEGDVLHFNGVRNTRCVNDLSSPSSFAQLAFDDTAGPFVLSGNALSLTPAESGATVVSSSAKVPVVVSNDVDVTSIPSSVLASGGAPVVFAGSFSSADGNYTDHPTVGGEVVFAGSASIAKLKFKDSSSVLRVAAGGSVAITDQQTLSAQVFSLGRFEVDAGGTLRIAETSDGGLRYTSGSPMHRVDGRLAVDSRLTGTVAQTFKGTGVFECATNVPTASTVEYTMRDGLRFVPSVWCTASPSVAGIARLVVSDATLGARSDWTFGPEGDVSLLSSTAAERALVAHGELTVDTADAGTGAAHTVTFVDPIDASDAVLVKAGAGVMVLPESGCDLSGGMRLEGGEVALSAPVETGALVFSGGGITLTPEFRSALADWTTVATATSVSGEPVDTSARKRLELRAVESGGAVLVQARKVRIGAMLIVR